MLKLLTFYAITYQLITRLVFEKHAALWGHKSFETISTNEALKFLALDVQSAGNDRRKKAKNIWRKSFAVLPTLDFLLLFGF